MSHWLRTHLRWVLVTTTAVIVTLGLISGGALAQTPPPGADKPGQPGPPGRPPMQAIANDFFAKLAGKLGVAPDRMTSAAKEVQKEQIDEAVKAGRMTPEMAARLKERIDAGQFILPPAGPPKPGPGGRGAGPGRPGIAPGGPMMDHAALATWLGITPEQLRTELNGKSLAQVAQAHGKTRDALITFLTDQVKGRIEQAVTAGRLTRQQADTMIEAFKQRVGQMVDQVHTAGGPGGRHGPGGNDGPRGPRGQQPGSTPTPRPNG